MGAIQNYKPTKPKADLLAVNLTQATAANAPELIMAARLSEKLGVSNVTLWRWRHDKRIGFPKGRRINRRVYFRWHEIAAWLERQQEVA